MCGIVGYVGKRNAIPIVLEGIKRLEYRGYDSAGIAFFDENNNLQVYKKEGKVTDLESSLPAPVKMVSNIGISHTRWATHGEPTQINSHPHTDQSKRTALVHNGIIENYKILKKKLEKEGHTFESETDTEVLAHLVGHLLAEIKKNNSDYLNDVNNLLHAVQNALKLVEGTFGIAVISSDFPGHIVAARRGSPIILGIGEQEFFVTSDVNATIIHTKKVIYMQDNEIAIINKDGFEITTIDNELVKATVSVVDWDVSSIDKGEYKHFMLKEIFEQPTAVFNAFRGRLLDRLSTARLGGLNMTNEEIRKVKGIHIIACGTSWHAGIVAKYNIENLVRIPVQVEYASEYRYRNPIIPEDTIVFVISQSGETADTLAALREAQARGARVLGITNVIGSTIARESDGGVYMYSGAEIGVASTKAFTCQLTILTLLALLMGRMNNLSPVFGAKFIEEMKKIPDKIQEILDNCDRIKEIAYSIKDSTNALYLGRGLNFPIALEGALKLKEISYIHAEGYPAAEMKHGPIALIDKNMPVIAIALKDSIYEKIISNLQEVKARNGRLITIATIGDENVKSFSDDVIYIPETIEELQPILSVIPMQLLAYYVADIRGYDVDQPRNLAKSVTVE